MATEERQPWDRRPDETPKGWAAFVAYREAGPRRSLAKLAAGDDPVSNRAQLGRWSSRYDWPARCAAWDEHLAAESAFAEVEQVREMRRMHAALGAVMVRKAARAVQDLDPARLTVRDAALLADLGAKLERTARGEPTVITEQIIDREGRAESNNLLSLFYADPRVGELADALAADGILDVSDDEMEDEG